MSAAALANPGGKTSPGSGKCSFDRATSSYLFAAVRKDLPAAIQVVQLCHAVAQAATCGGLEENTRFVLTSVPDQQALFALAARLREQGLSPCVFEEPDYAIGASALALAPGSARDGRAFSRLPLWTHD